MSPPMSAGNTAHPGLAPRSVQYASTVLPSVHAVHRADCSAQHVPLGAGLGGLDGAGLDVLGVRTGLALVVSHTGPVALATCNGAARVARGGGVGVESKLEKKPPIRLVCFRFMFPRCGKFFFPRLTLWSLVTPTKRRRNSPPEIFAHADGCFV